MRKFLAVVKREYVQRVRAKMFILVTLMAPVIISFFGIAPAIIFSIKAGGPIRVAVVDQTGQLYPSFYAVVMGDAGDSEDFSQPATKRTPPPNPGERLQQIARERQDPAIVLEEINAGVTSVDQIRTELEQRVRAKRLDGYLIIPADVMAKGTPEFFGSNNSDVFTRRLLQRALNRVVRERRFTAAQIDVQALRQLSRPVDLELNTISSTGNERDSGSGFALVFAVGFVMYLTILMYGQVILGAVIEEKETRIAEILFSSVRPFTLMMGKLVGVSFVALTQLAIWGIAFFSFAFFTGSQIPGGFPMHMPNIPPVDFVYFALFFLLGYFLYSTIYALVGSMVTTAQEGGQLAMPIILLLVIGFYLFLPVSRSPDSQFAFWVSMIPFFSPMTMLVRIVTQTPPFWQILLSFTIGCATVGLFSWIASRIYRIGMLMYGKKATIPEVLRWLRQA
ncbi:MAG: ABC transporter permease [Pyrinomonadaceae bacterium]